MELSWYVGAVGAMLALILWSFRARRIPHGLPSLPNREFYLGDLREAVRNHDRPYEWLTGLSEHFRAKGHRLFSFSLPTKNPRVVLLDPGMVHHLLAGKEWVNFEKGFVVESTLGDLVRGGIFAVDGKEWRRQRKSASHMFSQRCLREQMGPTVVAHLPDLLQQFEGAADSGSTLDVDDYLRRFTMDTGCQIIFGRNESTVSLGSDGAVFGKAFDAFNAGVRHRFRTPYRVVRFLRYFGLGPERSPKKSLATVNKYILEIVKQLQAGGYDSSENNLIAQFIKDARKRGEELSAPFLRSIVTNFLLAARDTTATAMIFCLWNLCRNPHELERVLKEVDPLLGVGESSRLATYEDGPKLKRLEAVLLESMRLYPPVSVDGKVCIKDTVFPDGSRVPAGCFVTYLLYCLGRNPDTWPDPLKFDSDRHFGKKPHDPSKYIVFNAGPRLCLGKPLALMEAKIVLASVLAKYKIAAVEGHNYAIQPSIVLQLQEGCPLHIAKR